ncbi:MAG: small-conductance mechanosensitive channel [Phenylobacterium sp.]
MNTKLRFQHRHQSNTQSILSPHSLSRGSTAFKTSMMLAFLFVCSGFSVGALAQSEEGTQQSAQQHAQQGTASAPMHHLGNEALLQQATGIYNEASDRYLSALRGVAKSRFVLNKAQKQIADLKPVKRRGSVKAGTPPLKAAKIEAEQAKIQHQAAKQRLALLEAEKVSLDGYAQLISPAQSAATGFLAALNELELWVFEIGLRVKDGSLDSRKVPGVLSKNSLANGRAKLLREQGGLAWQARVASKQSKQVTKDIHAAHQASIDAQAGSHSAQKKYSQELGGQSVKQSYLNKTPQQLLAELGQLDEELVWLQGAFNLSIGLFNTSKVKADERTQALEQLKAPEYNGLFQNTVVHVEEVEQAASKVEEVVVYHTERLKQLRALDSTLNTLVSQSEVFQGDGAVLNGHFFTMQVIARVLTDFVKQGKLTGDQIPANNRLAALKKSAQNAVEEAMEALSATKQATEQLAGVASEIQKSESTRTEIRHRLVQMKKTSAAAREAQQLNAGLKELTAQQIVERYEQNSAKVSSNQQTLVKARADYQSQLLAGDQAWAKLASLKGPLLLAAQDKTKAEQHHIAKKLYQLAAMDVPPEVKNGAVTSPGKTDGATVTTNLDVDNKHYQNLVSTRIRIAEQRQQATQEHLDGLKSLQQQLEAYIGVLNEANKLALQHYANSAELRKRAGRRELDSSAIPAGITQGLKRDNINALEQEIAGLAQQQIGLSQQIKALENKDTSGEDIQTLSSDVLALVGRRLDKLQDLSKLEQDFALSASDSERKSLEQAALRQLKNEDSIREYFASFVPSENSENMSALLRDYFVELIEIGQKQKNLGLQTGQVEGLIKLAEDEQVTINKLLPFFRQQTQQLQDLTDEQWVKSQIQLSPDIKTDKIQEILNLFEQQTGRRLAVPTAIAPADKAAAIKAQTALLYGYQSQMVAAQDWLRLFEKRLSAVPSGLITDIGHYQEKLGLLSTQNASMQRRVDTLRGQPEQKLAAAEAESKPMSDQERQLFVEGEINLLRSERLETSTQTGFWVVTRLVVIALITFLLLRLISSISAKKVKEEEGKDQASGQNLLIISLLIGACRLVVWAMATIIGLHFIGFDVGAILAGLGIFGFAIAMASRELIGNLIGGINILVAKPFVVGDYVLFDGRWCGVDQIGLQYTRLRQFKTKFLIIVPNSKLSEAPLINTNSDHNAYRSSLDLPLSRRNSPEKIDLAMKLIKDLVERTESVEMSQLFFKNFDEYAFVIYLRYDVKDIGNLPNAFDDVQIGIIKDFAAHGIEFAKQDHYNIDAKELSLSDEFSQDIGR